ncbi:MAG TPA: hypothetical protein VK828_12845 [Terriglobales bacterium]|nr:hypothetical protein [Terriglobales bacterium]
MLGFFLAFDAMARPRNSLKALGINFLAAGDAFSEAPFAYARQRSIDHIEQLTVIIALAEKKFLVVRTGGAISDILRRLIIGGATILLVAHNHVAQFLAPGFQSLPERLKLLLIHDCGPLII